MSSSARPTYVILSMTLGLGVIVKTQAHAPKIWDDRALADWATPVAALKVRPSHYTSAEYYAAPADNLRTYPVYLPGKEPAGYWEALQKRKPEPVVDASKIRTTQDWIDAGARAFSDLDSPRARTNDPALMAKARDPRTFENVAGLADGTVREPRWIVTDRGVMLTTSSCSSLMRTWAPIARCGSRRHRFDLWARRRAAVAPARWEPSLPCARASLKASPPARF